MHHCGAPKKKAKAKNKKKQKKKTKAKAKKIKDSFQVGKNKKKEGTNDL